MVTPPVTRPLRPWLVMAPGLALWAGLALLAYRSDWTLPQWLEGDPLEVYARVKLAAEQPLAWLGNTHAIPPLGAPGPADWSGYPVPDRLVFALTGWLAGWLGLLPAVQLVSSLIIGLNAASFFWCARWLRHRWEWAAGLAAVFALCNYNVRWGVSLSLGLTFLLPPLVLVCARCARRGDGRSPGGAWLLLAAAIGAGLALGNPYHAYFAGVVGGGALLLALFRRVPPARLAPLLVLLGVLSLAFFLNHAPFILRYVRGEGEPGLLRGMGDMATYALHPLDWVVPPNDHRLPAVARLGLRYQEWRHHQGEFFYNYLGWLGLAGLLVLLAHAARRGLRRGRLPDAVPGLGWITLFGVPGGLNYRLGLAGLDLFRASSRIGIYASLWIGLFLSGWLGRLTRRLARPVSIGLAGALAAGACWEATLPLSERNYPANNRRHWQRYEQLTNRLEASLPPGAAIFQLPVLPFPEAGRRLDLPDYEHLLPYLTSRNLRFSYGALRHDPKLRWGAHLAALPAAELIPALERAGFSVLWIDERGFADAARDLLAQLRSAGAEALPPADGLPYLHLFRLHAAAQPVAPDLGDPRWQEAWAPVPAGSAATHLLALQGWYPMESDAQSAWRWARREATLGIWHAGRPGPAVLHFRADAPRGTLVRIFRDGKELWHGRPGPEAHAVPLSLTGGLNSLVWRLEGSTFRPGPADARLLGFRVENLSLSVP